MRYTIFLLIVISAILLADKNILAQDSKNVEQVGRIYNQWDWAHDVDVVGNLAYVATERSGLQIVDISDPENLRVVGFWDNCHGHARGVTVSGDYAFLSDYGSGLFVISVADPENPKEVAFHRTEGYFNRIFVVDQFGYSINRFTIQIISLVNPEKPIEVGNLTFPYKVSNFAVSGDYAYVTGSDSGVAILNIADPKNPKEIGHIDLTHFNGNVFVSGNYAYLAHNYPAELRIISVADPRKPIEVGCYTVGSISDVAISGNYAYITDARNGMKVVSIVDPENPEEVGFCTMIYDDVRVTISGNYAYTAAESGGLRIISIADPENPVEVGSYSTIGDIYYVSISNDNAYISYSLDGWRIVSISEPENPIEVAHIEGFSFGRRFEVSGCYEYIVKRKTGFQIFSISNPENPVEVGHCNTSYGGNVKVSGDYAYVAAGSSGLRVISIADHENPVEVGHCDLPGNIADIEVTGNYVYAVNGRNGGNIPGFQIISIADPENPVQVGYNSTGRTLAVAVKDDFAYVTTLYHGLRVLDISDPRKPEVIGDYKDIIRDPLEDGFDYDTRRARSITISDEYLYIANGLNGLRIFSIADPENLVEVGYYNTPGEAWGVAVLENGLVYVADYTNLGIYRLNDPNVNQSWWQRIFRFPLDKSSTR